MDANDDATASTTVVVTPWTGIYVTLAVSLLQGLVFYMIFTCLRNKDHKKYHRQGSQEQGSQEGAPPTAAAGDTTNTSATNPRGDGASGDSCFDLYEPRQHTRAHRSPPPFSSSKHWLWEVWTIRDTQLLNFVGLDTFMFLRVLRLGARICAWGSFLSLALLPVYATGHNTGKDTEQFNLFTLAKVESGSSKEDAWRLYVAVGSWWIFVAFCLKEFLNEWKSFVQWRSEYFARGDADMSMEYRYTVQVEQVSTKQNARPGFLYDYFEQLFPGKVRAATSCYNTTKIEKLIKEREANLLKLEAATAMLHAKPNKPRPKIRVQKKEVDAMEHYQDEITRLNTDIDTWRSTHVPGPAQPPQTTKTTTVTTTPVSKVDAGGTEAFTTWTSVVDDDDTTTSTVDPRKSATTTSGFVTFTSLCAKQAAVQCELTGNPDSMVVVAADDPNGMLWSNVHVPLVKQKSTQFCVSCFWMVGILFWAVPVSFVTSIANLNSILQTFKLKPANPSAAWYGLVSGLLPVVFLAILMAVLYMAIQGVATSLIRYKSWSDVNSYTLYWHMLFQFANLWLILIGGSAFNQMDAILEDPKSILNVLASALPAASTFFVNMIVVATFGSLGLELSMIPQYAVNLVMNCIIPEAGRTQRQLDQAKTPPSIVWGKVLPPIVFIFLVAFLYMPIVPIIEIFALAYFCGMYTVWKHQCLHVYAQPTEGGGDTTWQQVFGFLMACLYTGELVFIAYMGIKKAPIPGGLAFVPLIVTFLFHKYLLRKYIRPIRNLPLEIAARVDGQDGELDRQPAATSTNVYLQPFLDPDQDEREPMPYRRVEDSDTDALL